MSAYWTHGGKLRGVIMGAEDRYISDSGEVSLAQVFTVEHHEIDAGIERYLADTDADPVRRAEPLLSAMKALRRHIYLEEEIVFPYLQQGTLMMPLMVMRKEHGQLWQRIDALVDTLHNSSGEPTQVEEICTEILQLLGRHNQKEEPIIYPHMDADLTADEQDKVRDLLAGGTMPEGWICEALR